MVELPSRRAAGGAHKSILTYSRGLSTATIKLVDLSESKSEKQRNWFSHSTNVKDLRCFFQPKCVKLDSILRVLEC